MFVESCNTYLGAYGLFTQCSPLYTLGGWGGYGIWGHRWHRGWWR